MKKVTIIFIAASLFIPVGTATQAQTDWTKYEGNPVLRKGPAESWENEAAAFSEVILDGSTFKMWYAGWGLFTDRKWRIGYAESSDGISWTKHASNPVIDLGPSGSWDDESVTPGAVIFDGSSYKMWYRGYDGAISRTGYATSPDGIVWTKHASNPVLDVGAGGEWDGFWAGISAVIFNGSDYQGWYIGTGGNDFNFRTGYATSPDGITWTKHPSNPVMNFGASGEWDNAKAGVDAVIYNGSIYEMWYEGGRGAQLTQIGYATSTDGLVWTKHASNPVLPVGPFNVWDWSMLIVPSVLYDGTSYHLWYTGLASGQKFQIGYATSISVGIADEGVVPEKYELSQNYPNPFNPETVIRYSIPKAEEVSLVVYNLIGEEVAHLIDERKPAGSYTVKWNASNISSGIYFYRLQAGDFVLTRKMVLLK
ncbi:T9SS type A sorting domain-containing protein [Candidatus Marinimicrobia bacterium MT.SAG.2]|nr:T9SS type A sorting domain-containing protein [Candidatus Marinimicrobia bacterium MT.SAG.2]